jgi:hypothetical protein
MLASYSSKAALSQPAGAWPTSLPAPLTCTQVWRPQAKVSVLDSGFMLGDGVWEGIRVHRGVMAFAEQHLERLYEGAKAIDMDLGLSQAQLAGLVYDTLDANGMQEATGGWGPGQWMSASRACVSDLRQTQAAQQNLHQCITHHCHALCR